MRDSAYGWFIGTVGSAPFAWNLDSGSTPKGSTIQIDCDFTVSVAVYTDKECLVNGFADVLLKPRGQWNYKAPTTGKW